MSDEAKNVEKVSEVAKALSDLECAIDCLDKSINRLNERTSSVWVNVPEEAPGQQKITAEKCDLVTSIDDKTGSIKMILGRINLVIEGLQI